MAKVSLANLRQTFPARAGGVAMAGANLEIIDREFAVILGPTGSGKSALLRMIAGLEKASEGEISIDDRRVNDLAPAKRDVAMVVGSEPLYPAMSVRANLATGLQLQSFNETEIKRRIDDAAEILGLTELLDRKPHALTGAERQRVAIGRAVVRQPKVFLLDEPLAGLGAEARKALRTEIAQLHLRLNATIIYATTNSADAMMLADRIIILKEGAVQQVDTPQALYGQPGSLAVAQALGTPAMNLIRGSLKQERETVRFIEDGDGSIDLTFSTLPMGARELIGQPIVLGVRPEQITVVDAPKEQGYPVGSFPAVAELVEPLGTDTILHLQTGAHTLLCRTRKQVMRNEAGRRMRFFIEESAAHFFNPATDLRLC